ncbi:MAG: histone deacetylase family protein [gamma proteobacterium symbiont of Taylorina sp.]|nr:histone deacetylase family protein [gamma proteobacterium symbiont of Taylorina sp.]
MNKTAYITHSACLKHDTGSGHPESPQRLIAIEEQLKESGVFNSLSHYEAPLVSNNQLEQVHSQSYLDFIESNAPVSGGDTVNLDPDTQMSYHSLEAARRAAGAVVLATDLVLAGEVNNAVCAVRPPGHHAKKDRAMGFCIYNNIMVGIYHALEYYGLERVALLDFDVHHGNGSENIIADDDRILFCSTYQHPYYPYEPCQNNEHKVCSPLPAGAGSKEFKAEVSNKWLPALKQFQPEMIFISAGFDAHEDDYLAGLNFTEDDYYWVTEKIVNLAGKYAAGRIVSSLEGGYNTGALAKSVEVHLLALLDS